MKKIKEIIKSFFKLFNKVEDNSPKNGEEIDILTIVANKLTKISDKEISIRKDNDSNIVNIFIENEKALSLDYDIFIPNKICGNKEITPKDMALNWFDFMDYKYFNIIKGLLGKLIFIKDDCPNKTIWSYINENSESSTYTEQIEYNQTLGNRILCFKFDNIVVNPKLLELFKTLNDFIPEENIIKSGDKVVKVNFLETKLGEKIIYGYNSKKTILPNRILSKEYLDEADFDFLIDMFGDEFSMSTSYGYIEIANMDNGIYGTSNDQFRVKNGVDLILTLRSDMTDEEIAKISNSMVALNAQEFGITNIKIKRPESKYTYLNSLMSKFKNELEKGLN